MKVRGLNKVYEVGLGEGRGLEEVDGRVWVSEDRAMEVFLILKNLYKEKLKDTSIKIVYK